MYLKRLRISFRIPKAKFPHHPSLHWDHFPEDYKGSKDGNPGEMGRRELPNMAIASKVKSPKILLLLVKLLSRQKDPSSDREGMAENIPLRNY